MKVRRTAFIQTPLLIWKPLAVIAITTATAKWEQNTKGTSWRLALSTERLKKALFCDGQHTLAGYL
jgi:hypothetical protein